MKAHVIAVERQQNGFGEDSADRADESGNRVSRVNLYRSIVQAFAGSSTTAAA